LSLTLRKEHTLRVTANRVLRKICGPGDEEDQHDKLCDSCSIPNIILTIKTGRTRWTWHTAYMGGKHKQGFGGET
jgi:hypothetical protein